MGLIKEGQKKRGSEKKKLDKKTNRITSETGEKFKTGTNQDTKEIHKALMKATCQRSIWKFKDLLFKGN